MLLYMLAILMVRLNVITYHSCSCSDSNHLDSLLDMKSHTTLQYTQVDRCKMIHCKYLHCYTYKLHERMALVTSIASLGSHGLLTSAVCSSIHTTSTTVTGTAVISQRTTILTAQKTLDWEKDLEAYNKYACFGPMVLTNHSNRHRSWIIKAMSPYFTLSKLIVAYFLKYDLQFINFIVIRLSIFSVTASPVHN